jgi:hypothetical protein
MDCIIVSAVVSMGVTSIVWWIYLAITLTQAEKKFLELNKWWKKRFEDRT